MCVRLPNAVLQPCLKHTRTGNTRLPIHRQHHGPGERTHHARSRHSFLLALVSLLRRCSSGGGPGAQALCTIVSEVARGAACVWGSQTKVSHVDAVAMSCRQWGNLFYRPHSEARAIITPRARRLGRGTPARCVPALYAPRKLPACSHACVPPQRALGLLASTLL